MVIRFLRPTARRWRSRVKILASGPGARRHAMVGPHHLWRQKRQFQIDYLLSQGMERTHTVMDLGCGTLRGGVPIIQYLKSGHYYGVEVRSNVIAQAHKEIQDRRLFDKAPSLVLASRLGDLTLGTAFDYVWSFSVLFHMDDDNLTMAFDCVAENLALQGIFLANVKIGEPRPERGWQGFPIVWRTEEDYATLA